MSERIEIKPYGASPRQLDHIVGVLVRGGLIAYPTDSGYALGWRSNNRKARDRVIRLRGLDPMRDLASALKVTPREVTQLVQR